MRPGKRPRLPCRADASIHLFDTLVTCHAAGRGSAGPANSGSTPNAGSKAQKTDAQQADELAPSDVLTQPPQEEASPAAAGNAGTDAQQPTPEAKSQLPPEEGAAEGEAAAGSNEEALEFRASAFLLASYSPFFERALAKEWGGEGKRLEVTATCPESFGHLLEWMHSLGKALPQDPAAKGGLLATAHAFGVEQCVAVAAAALADEASSLSWQLANDVLALLLGKECEGQDAAAALTALCTALAERLLHLLGKVDDALNDDEQTARICALPLPVLEALLASNCLLVDCEEMVFCAVAQWMNASGLPPEGQVAAAACLLPHVRFAHMRPVNSANYWHYFSWFREWDRDKEVLLEALVHASDAQLAQACKYQDASLPAKFVKRPSYKQLTSLDIVSEIDVSSIVNGESAYGKWHYWAGHRWRVSCDLTQEGDGIGLYLSCNPLHGSVRADSGLIGTAAVGPRLEFSFAVANHNNGGGGDSWSSAHTGRETVLRPLFYSHPGGGVSGAGHGWARFPFTDTIDGAPITRANFRAPGSPVVRDGKMTVKAAITLKN